MIHLKSYNESAGQLWRQVTRAEMSTRMGGQVVDTFTEAEVLRITTLCRSLGKVDHVAEHEIPAKVLNYQVFRYIAKELTVHPLGQYDRRSAPEVIVPANNLLISLSDPNIDGLLDHHKAYIFDIFKSAEDWFFVSKTPYLEDFQDQKWYVCDGLSGLLSMLEEVMGT